MFQECSKLQVTKNKQPPRDKHCIAHRNSVPLSSLCMVQFRPPAPDTFWKNSLGQALLLPSEECHPRLQIAKHIAQATLHCYFGGFCGICFVGSSLTFIFCRIVIHLVNDHYKISRFQFLFCFVTFWNNDQFVGKLPENIIHTVFFLWHLPISVYRYVAEGVLDELFNSVHQSSSSFISSWRPAPATHLVSPISGPHPRRFLRYTPSPIK